MPPSWGVDTRPAMIEVAVRSPIRSAHEASAISRHDDGSVDARVKPRSAPSPTLARRTSRRRSPLSHDRRAQVDGGALRIAEARKQPSAATAGPRPQGSIPRRRYHRSTSSWPAAAAWRQRSAIPLNNHVHCAVKVIPDARATSGRSPGCARRHAPDHHRPVDIERASTVYGHPGED